MNSEIVKLAQQEEKVSNPSGNTPPSNIREAEDISVNSSNYLSDPDAELMSGYISPCMEEIEPDDIVIEDIYVQYINDDDDYSTEKPVETEEYYFEEQKNDESTESTSVDRDSKRKYYGRKMHCCIYCNSLQSHLPRHLFRKHRTEPLVKEAFTADTERRKYIMEKLRKDGDLNYNKNQSGNTEKIIPVYSSTTCEANRLPCPICGGYYSKLNMSRHVKKQCSIKNSQAVMSNISGASRVAGIEVLKIASPKLVESIFPTIRDPEILKVAAQDKTIVIFANRLVDSYYQEGLQTQSNQHFNYIASKIRLVAKLFIEIRKINTEIMELKEVFAPKHYYTMIQAIKALGGFKDGLFRAPSTASTCCTLVGHVANCLRIEAVCNENEVDEKKVQNFMLLMRDRQNIDITKIANENRAAIQRTTNITLPTTREINEFMTELMNELDSLFQRFRETFNSQTYHMLSQVSLVSIMVFNRKRPGDCEKTRIVEWLNMSSVGDEHIQKLNDEKKRKYASEYHRFVTQGKLNKKSSIVVSRKIRDIVNELLTLRDDPDRAKDLNIASSNPYVFAAPIGRKYPFYKAEQCLQTFCRNKKIEFSKFKANVLRKHLATSTSTLPYDRQRIVSDFMGHGMEIHNNIYKQRQVQVDCIEIGEILSDCGGWLHKGIDQENYNKSDSLASSERFEDDLEPQPSTSRQNLEHINSEQPGTSQKHQEPASNELRFYYDLLDEGTREDDSDDLQRTIGFSDSSEPQPGTSQQHGEPSNSFARRRLFPQVATKKRTWTTPEKKIVRSAFKRHFNENTIPSLAQIEEAKNKTKLGSLSRTSQQIRKWIEHQQKLQKTAKIGWDTPQRKKCRRIFREYYERKTMNIYPSIMEIQAAINEHPEFRGKTVNQIRSHIQHDIQYLRRPERRVLKFE